MKVQEFMTTNIKFVDAEESAYDAIEKMVDRRIRSLVVRFNKKTSENPGFHVPPSSCFQRMGPAI